MIHPESTCAFHVKCTCAMVCLNLDLLLQNSITLEICRIVVSQNCCSCMFADKREHCNKSDIILCIK